MVSRQKFGFARRGAAVMLAAALATGAMPAVALAEAADVRGDDAVAAAAHIVETGDGFYMEQGKAYSLAATYAGTGNFASMSDMVSSMLGRYFGGTVDVSANDDGSYAVVVSFSEYSAAIGDMTCNGSTISQIDRKYTFTVSSIASPIDLGIKIGGAMAGMFPNGITYSMTLDTSSLPTEAPSTGETEQPNRTALQELIGQAKAIEKGSKSDEAWAALQKAIQTAEGALFSAMPDSAIPQVTAVLQTAIDDFNASADVQAPVENPYDMKEGVLYSANVAYSGTGSYATEDFDAIIKQMLGRYFGNAVTLRYLEDGTYDVIFSFVEYSSALGDMVCNGQTISQSADRTYVVNVPAIADAVDLRVYIGGAMAGMFPDGVTFAADVDTASIKEAPVAPEGGGEQGGGEVVVPKPPVNPDAGSGPSDNVEKGFQVGHTYQVPLSFCKTGTAETSMSAQYFGDTALVRPQSDGTFSVSFSTNRPDFISSLSSARFAISQNGPQFTFSMPASDSDAIVPVSMSIVPMSNMSVSADMHLGLSRAVDLGEGKDGLAASSVAALAKTGDDAALPMALVGLAGAAAAGAVLAAARRRSGEE